MRGGIEKNPYSCDQALVSAGFHKAPGDIYNDVVGDNAAALQEYGKASGVLEASCGPT